MFVVISYCKSDESTKETSCFYIAAFRVEPITMVYNGQNGIEYAYLEYPYINKHSLVCEWEEQNVQ